MPSAPPHAIEAVGVSRGFGDVQVLRALDETVRAGERVALAGGNGAGKTTLLRIVAGTVQPDAGQVRVGGAVAGTTQAKRRTGVCFALDRSFFEPLTAAQNLTIFARMRLSRREAERAVGRVCEELELGWLADRPVAGFSAGMRGQLGLGRALLADPEVLLLDEPTRSLDDAAVDRMWAALERRPRAAVLMATHRRADIDRCDRTIALGLP